MLSRATLIWGLLFCLVLYGADLLQRKSAQRQNPLTVSVQEGFDLAGKEVTSFAPFARGRYWKSEANGGLDAHRLVLGPFVAPEKFHFLIGGYPGEAGNAVFLELPLVNYEMKLDLPNPGDFPVLINQTVPEGFRGRKVNIIVTVQARGNHGWVGISEPLDNHDLSPRGATLLSSLAGWGFNGLLLAVLCSCAARWLAPRGWIADHWIPLASIAIVGFFGYLNFWGYFISPTLGKSMSLLLLTTGLIGFWKQSGKNAINPYSFRIVTSLQVVIGISYLALLFLYKCDLGFYDLAANRFILDLPGDNRIPHDFAIRLYNGGDPRILGASWLSSDRPPAQTGWLLLFWQIDKLLGLDEIISGAASAVWLQLSWIAGAYGLFCALQLPSRRACAWIAALSLNGFYLLNTVFTWPKLSAGAFACGAFALWFIPNQGKNTCVSHLLGGALAAMAWLNHGGIAFSFLALAPIILYQIARGSWRPWGMTAASFVLIVAPWTVYQKVYNPPADRLLKWHLAGQESVDQRGIWQTLRESYGALEPREIALNKISNFKLLVSSNFWQMAQITKKDSILRRRTEFIETMRGLTWWVMGFTLLAAELVVRKPGRTSYNNELRLQLRLAAWVAATFVIWCLLMFGPATTVIQSGSFVAMIVLFCLLSCWIDQFGKYGVIAVALLQLVTLSGTWFPPTPVTTGPISALACFIAISSLAILAGIVGSTLHSGLSKESDPLPART